MKDPKAIAIMLMFTIYVVVLSHMRCPATLEEERKNIIERMGFENMSCTVKAHDMCAWVRGTRRDFPKEEMGHCLVFWLERFCNKKRPPPVIKKFKRYEGPT